MHHLLLPAQAWWDAQRFNQPQWQLEGWQDQKARHIQLHVAKAVGKVLTAYGTGVGPVSDPEALARVRHEVLPDVAIYRSQLLQTFPDCGDPATLPPGPGGCGTAQAVPSHAGGVLHAAQLLPVLLGLSYASARLAVYLEPREHGIMSPLAPIWEAVQALHSSAQTLAIACGMDLARAHQARLEALLGAPLPTALVAEVTDQG